MPLTRGFATKLDLADHFQKHGREMGAATEQEYEQLADAFLGSPVRPPVVECERRNGDRVRCNPDTNEFGVIARSGVIRTYYDIGSRNKRRFPSPLDYWREQCRR